MADGEEPITISDDEEWIKCIINAGATKANRSQTRKLRMQKVPQMLRANKDFQKYFAPRVVSIGPYHHGNPVLQHVQNLKPVIASKFVLNEPKRFQEFYEKILRRIREVRGCYDEESTQGYTDKAFARMMLLDGCFVLYFIRCVTRNLEHDLGMTSLHITFAQQDLLLLENQLPFLVIQDLMDPFEMTMWKLWIHLYLKVNFKTGTAAHLLELLRNRMVDYVDINKLTHFTGYTSRNIKELMAVGIEFKPSESNSLTDISFTSHQSYADLRLPKITVDSSTKSNFFNLIADEVSSDEPNELWVTSYICFLSTLVANPDDVKILQSAKVLDNRLGSDGEVASLFHELAIDLVPNPYAYANVKKEIQNYYEETISSSWFNKFCRYKKKTYLSQLKEDHLKNPWRILALVGAILALIFTGAQAYFQIWSPPS
ncbi:unnamed protein product [Ilex paraguariensis]|uniref:Uncharacterized protein n=1 Tax=Ilex paraguariensis TaxID=185542 RepID=A0ABC8USS8_9AQUA